MAIIETTAKPLVLRRPRARGRGRVTASLCVGGGILVALVIAAVIVGIWPPYDPNLTVAGNLEAPSAAHPLGTDNLGRDSMTRLILAARTSIVISAVAAVLAAILGTTLGLLAGYVGGWLDTIFMRGVDVVLALPAILVAMIVGVIIGRGPIPLIIALGIVYAPGFARVMRAPVISLRERDFVLSAKLSGLRTGPIVSRHLLPNVLTPLLVQFALVASSVVLLEAALSYLGLGIPAPEPDAGRMVSEMSRYMGLAPLQILLPAALIVVLATAWNLLADGLQDLLAPRRESAASSRRRPRRPKAAPPSAPQTAPQTGNIPTSPGAHE